MLKRKTSPVRGKLPEKAIAALLLLWILLVFSRYFSFRNVLNLSFLSTILDGIGHAKFETFFINTLGSLSFFFCAAAVLFTLWRIGTHLRKWFGVAGKNLAINFCLEMALGMMFFSQLWLGLGFNRLWYDPLMTSLGAGFFLFAALDFKRHYGMFQKFPKTEWPGWLFAGVGGLGLFFLAVSVAQGLTPEVYYDALTYHLSTLRYWEFQHGVADFPTNLYSYYPFGAELFFLNAFHLQGGEAAKLLNVSISGLCALAAAGWMWEKGGAVFGCLAWGTVLVLPLVSATVWTTQNDVVLAFFLTLAFYAMERWSQDRGDWRWALAVGLLGAAAAGVKYTGILFAYAGLAALFWTRPDTRPPKVWPQWGLMKAFILLGLAPWLLRNELFTGNPLYPYFSHWLGGRELPAPQMAALMADHESPFAGGLHPAEWFTRVLTRDLDKTIAPVLFGFAPFLLLPGKWGKETRFLGALSGLLLATGFLISHQPRLLIPAFLISGLFSVSILADLGKPLWTRVWACGLAVFGVLSLPSVARLSVEYYQSYKTLVGIESRGTFLRECSQTFSYYAFSQEAGKFLWPDCSILVVGDARGLYYPVPFTTCSVFDEQVLLKLAREQPDGRGVWKKLHEMGFDALAVSGIEAQRLARQYAFFQLNPKDEKKLEEFIREWTDLKFVERENGLYFLRTSPAANPPEGPPLLRCFLKPA